MKKQKTIKIFDFIDLHNIINVEKILFLGEDNFE